MGLTGWLPIVLIWGTVSSLTARFGEILLLLMSMLKLSAVALAAVAVMLLLLLLLADLITRAIMCMATSLLRSYIRNEPNQKQMLCIGS